MPGSGDFNIHVDNAGDTDAIKFIDLLESYGLQQHVTSPTHKHDHTLENLDWSPILLLLKQNVILLPVL